MKHSLRKLYELVAGASGMPVGAVDHRKVDFFIIGAQKAGTTALHSMLANLPELQMSAKKEIHFFDRENRNWSNPDYSELHKHFDWTVSGVQRGEATPVTAYWPGALARLKRYNPHARLILIVRHPVFRAYSHWKMEYKRGRENRDFDYAMSKAGRARMNGEAHRVYSYVERGFYGQALQHILEHFPAEQILVTKSDDFRREPQETLQSVMNFLGLETSSAGHMPMKSDYIVKVDTRKLGELNYENRKRHEELYVEDIRKFEKLSGISVGEWFDPEYLEASGGF